MSSPSLDLRARAFTYLRGDITIYGSWLRIDGQFRPCMVFVRTGEETGEHTIPCVITADKAWIWDEHIGDPRQAAQIIVSFIDALRLSHNKSTWSRLFSLVHDHLDDLIGIPPMPPLERKVVADIIHTDHQTGKTREVEVKDYV